MSEKTPIVYSGLFHIYGSIDPAATVEHSLGKQMVVVSLTGEHLLSNESGVIALGSLDSRCVLEQDTWSETTA